MIDGTKIGTGQELFGLKAKRAGIINGPLLLADIKMGDGPLL
jgi:hypothetical protein